MSSRFHLNLNPGPILICCCFLILLISTATGTVFSDSLDTCHAQCVDRDLVVPLARGAIDWEPSLLAVNLTQRRSACRIGCQDLESSNSTCEERCTTVTPTDVCIQGCRAVTDIFLHQIQGQREGLLNHASVTIADDHSPVQLNTIWILDNDYGSVINDISAGDIEWAVQSRPADASVAWSITILEEKAFKTEMLKATVTVPLVFAKEVELRLCISWRTYIVVSPTYRLPVNDTNAAEPLPPTIISQLQISATSFVVCWKSALQRLYKVSLYSLEGNEILTAVVESSCYLFQDLQGENCCRVEIGYANSATSTSTTSTSLRIDLINPEGKSESAPQLIFTNGTSVMKLYDVDDYAVLSDPKVIPFELTHGRSITALGSVSAEHLLVALDDGSIYRLTNDDDKVFSELLRPPDGTAIVQMEVDHVQGAVYAVLFKKGLLRCGLKECKNSTILLTNTINYIEYISVDSWNGHIYCILNGGEVFSIPLFPLNAPHILPFSATEKIPGLATAIEAEPENARLISVTQNGSILAINTVNQSVTDLRLNIEVNDLYHSIKKAHFLGKRLFWISTSCGDTHRWDTCLYSEEYDVEKNKIHLNRYLYAGRVVDFVFSRNSPLPLTIPPPSRIGLITGANTARVTWKPPVLLPFQAQGSWRDLHYECRIIGNEENGTVTTEFVQLNQTSLLVPISPGLQYHASVRACMRTICSSYANAINTAFAPFTGFLFTTFNRTIDNTSYYGILGDPLENYTLPVPMPAREGIIFAYDLSVKSLYIAETDQSAIIRTHEDGSSQHFLDTVTIKYMTLMPRFALIILASDYLIVTYRLTSSFDQEIYSCESFTECGEVAGLAGDDETGDVFYLIRYLNGTTSLYALNQDVRTPYFIASSQEFPVLRQLIVIKEKLAFITETGEMGFCDKRLGSLNINLDLNNVALAPVLSFEPMKPITFTKDLITDDASARNTLVWGIQPATLSKGKVLFKITMYKEQWGGAERFVDYSLSHSYTISGALLRQWPSRQKYDAEVVAITAWDVASINQTGLIVPTKPPTPPTNLTIYATQQKTVDGARALMDLFWDEPLEWNGETLGYVINCTVDGIDEPTAEVPATTRFYSFSVKSGSISCAVAARNEPTLETFSEPVTIDSSELRPLVRLFAIDANNNLMSVPNWLPAAAQTATRAKRQTPPPPMITEQLIAYIGNELYSIRKDFDSTQPFLLRLDPNNVENILHKVSIGGEIGKVDAITSDWVANRLLFVSSARVMQLPLDAIQSLSVITPRRILNLSSGAGDAKQLLFDPFSNTAFLLTKNGSLFALDLNIGIEENMALRLECLKSETVTSMMGDFAWNLALLPGIYVLTWNGMMRVDLTSSKCEEIKFAWDKFGEKGLKSILSFAIADKLYIFATSSELVVYELGSGMATPIAVNGSPLKQILVATQSSQPFPERSCFVLPPASEIKFTVRNEERSGALISINEPQLPNTCPGISLPPTQYEIHFRRKGSDKIRNIHSVSNVLHIENGVLDKETDYEVSISWFNRYTPVSEASETQMLQTGYGFPSSPQEPAAFALTPDVVLLYWKLPLKPNAPIPEIKYMISQLSATLTSPSAIGAQQFEGAHYAATATDVVSCLNNPCSAKISNLRPSTDYKFWVRAIHESHLNKQFADDAEASSLEAAVRTKDVAGTLRPDNITGTAVVLRWNSLDPESPPKRISIQYRIDVVNAAWKSPYNASFEGSAKSVAVVLSALRSSTTYDYRFAAEYVESYKYAGHEYPYSETFYQVSQQIRTKPGTPSAPASIRLVQEYNEWIVRWEKPLNDGGSPITSYALEFRPNENIEWEIAERGLDGDCLWWKPSRINFLADGAEFRVHAANSEGFGAYAYSKHHDDSSGESHTQSLWAIIITLLIAIFLLTVAIAVLFIYYQRNDRKRCKIRPQEISLHGCRNSISRSVLPPNIINDLKTIPRVPKNSISLSRTLGKGSFGEVYEGIACGLPQAPTKGVRVAVKTLRNGFSESERMKFLQEAILMNNFDHPNIVKLLGVSFETEPYFLIIELMEGGDLLGFLRSSRPSDCLPSQLSLYELIGMMVDVGRGAAYLEANRHVHRDLAARNCLISSRNSNTRITKIADFGLARDVYTNDYYRVHGDDFLPLRWLSPESVNDGIFTPKSDVWSFGILLWEILTLGQQPYASKNNVQVMSFVKSGGKPEKPQFCPDEIFAIVERAWIYDPEERPRFADLLPDLEALRGCPAYQEDIPYPPSSLCTTLTTDSNFELSFNSNISRGESGRSGSVRFDKSDNPSTKKQGRPSVLRSLRKERPKPPPSLDDLEASSRRSRSVDSITSDADSITRDFNDGCENGAFVASDCYEVPLKKMHPRKTPVNRPKQRAPDPPNDSPASSSSSSSCSSPPSCPSPDDNNDSLSMHIRPARVSRV